METELHFKGVRRAGMHAVKHHCYSNSLRYFSIWLVMAFSSGVGASKQNSSMGTDKAPSTPSQISVKGCLGGTQDQLFLSTSNPPGTFALTGQTSGLEKYVGKEIVVEGSEGGPVGVEGYFDPFRSFEVARLEEVVPEKVAKLGPSFTSTADWRAEKISKYGVRFLHPYKLPADASQVPPPDSNFVTQEGTEIVSVTNISQEAYPQANFGGGIFYVSVNPHITNRASCMQFGRPGPREAPPSSIAIGKVLYAEITGGGGAMGTWESDYYFHTFRNGLCYELAFNFTEHSAHTAESGCNIPLLSDVDEWKLIQPLIVNVSFFRPTLSVKPSQNTSTEPDVMEFSASSRTADYTNNRGLITFSWSVSSADYIELSFQCSPAPTHPGIVILEEGFPYSCGNAQPRFDSTVPRNRSPKGSANFLLGNSYESKPITVTVTITPFLRGVGHPEKRRSITIQVDPMPRPPRG